MANSLDIQITEDGERNAVVKLTGVLDSSNIAETPAVELRDFAPRDSSGRQTLVGFRVDLIEYSIGAGIEIQLEWNGTIPQQIFPISGRGRISATNYGGFVPDRTRAGYDGSINLRTKNFIPGVDGMNQPVVQNFTVILELVKLYSV
jgi:hypothetical protein